MYLIIIMGIYHLLKVIFREDIPDETASGSHAMHGESRHPAEIQLR